MSKLEEILIYSGSLAGMYYFIDLAYHAKDSFAVLAWGLAAACLQYMALSKFRSVGRKEENKRLFSYTEPRNIPYESSASKDD